jgi:hypothetical protein
VSQATESYYFDSYVKKFFENNVVSTVISAWNLTTNASSKGMLSNRYDLPFEFAKEL